MRESLGLIVEYVGFYFLWTNIIYGLLFLLSFLVIKRRSKKKIDTLNLPAVSFLIPSFNEEALIVETLQTHMAMKDITKEIIVIDDGSKDATMDVLKNFYQLQLIEESGDLKIYQSITHSELKVISSVHHGKAQSLNIGLTYAQHEIVCTMDADTIPHHDGVVQCLHEIQKSPKIYAIGGIITPLNGEKINNNQVSTYSRRSWFVTQQRLEYLRSFVCERLGKGMIQGTVLISGAMAMFRRDSLKKIGGFPLHNLTEDFAVIMNLRAHHKQKGQIKILPVLTGWTQVPNNWKNLINQRSRWQIGLIQTLSKHLSMIFNPTYGTVGVFVIPYLWLTEVISPIIELATYMILPLAWYHGLIRPQMLLYLLGINLFITMAGLYLEQKYILRLRRPTYFFSYLWTALTAFFSYKPFLTIVRLMSMIKLIFRKSSWKPSMREEVVHSPR